MLCITFDRYIEGFSVLEKYSEEYPLMISHLLDTVYHNFKTGFSMLDIGAGTGNFATDFIRQCAVPVLGYTAIEPSSDHIAKLQKNFKKLPINIEIINEYYSPETVLEKKFDLVMFSHSMYCFLPDPEPFLLHSMDLLSKDGIVVIYHGSPSNFCNILNILFRDILPPDRVTDPTFTSWEVRNILKKNQISHSVSFLPGYFRADDIFRPENVRIMHELITFSLMVEAESFEPIILNRIEEILRNISYPSDVGLLLNLGVDAIVLNPKAQ